MKPFRIADLKKINEIPTEDSPSWLVNAEGSIEFLRLSADSDDIVIYASGSSVLVHGLLAPTTNLTPPNADDLQHNNIPMPEDSWRIQKVWGGGEGHRMYLEAPLSFSSKSFQGGEKLIWPPKNGRHEVC